MIINKLKINLPPWNCSKCLVVRKEWIVTELRKKKFVKSVTLEFYGGEENSDTKNSEMIREFVETVRKIVDDDEIKIRVEIYEKK